MEKPNTGQKHLTGAQIESLFDFTYRKRVRYYDVQIELVDHLATAIEERWRQQPELPFERALEEVYATFGIFGFAKIVMAREDAIQQQARREIDLFFRSLLHIDRFWLPLGLFTAFYLMFALAPAGQLAWVPVILASVSLPIFVLAIRYIRRARRTAKTFLLLEMPKAMALGASFGMYGTIYSWNNVLLETSAHNQWLFAALALFDTVFLLYAFAAVVHLPRRAEALLREQFPRYA